MKTTSPESSKSTTKAYLSHLFTVSQNSSSYDQSLQLNDLDSIKNLINGNKSTKGVAEYFFWSDDRVPSDKLLEAWTHKSFIHENGLVKLDTYERWEFLGDAVFGEYITRELFVRFSSKKEGELSKIKNQLVSGETMAKLTRVSGLDQLILLGRGEVKRESYTNDALLADIFEATIGVLSSHLPNDELKLFLDGLISQYEAVTESNFYCQKELLKKEVKGQLQELTMKLFRSLPEYRSKDLGNGFTVELFVNGECLATETNVSKKVAQKLCAAQAIKKLTH